MQNATPISTRLLSVNWKREYVCRSFYTHICGCTTRSYMSSSLSGAGPNVQAISRSDGKHSSHIRIPGTPLRVDLVLVLVLERANLHPQAVRPSLATRWKAEDSRF